MDCQNYVRVAVRFGPAQKLIITLMTHSKLPMLRLQCIWEIVAGAIVLYSKCSVSSHREGSDKGNILQFNAPFFNWSIRTCFILDFNLICTELAQINKLLIIIITVLLSEAQEYTAFKVWQHGLNSIDLLGLAYVGMNSNDKIRWFASWVIK